MKTEIALSWPMTYNIQYAIFSLKAAWIINRSSLLSCRWLKPLKHRIKSFKNYAGGDVMLGPPSCLLDLLSFVFKLSLMFVFLFCCLEGQIKWSAHCGQTQSHTRRRFHTDVCCFPFLCLVVVLFFTLRWNEAAFYSDRLKSASVLFWDCFHLQF